METQLHMNSMLVYMETQLHMNSMLVYMERQPTIE